MWYGYRVCLSGLTPMKPILYYPALMTTIPFMFRHQSLVPLVLGPFPFNHYLGLLYGPLCPSLFSLHNITLSRSLMLLYPINISGSLPYYTRH
ncbi:hypothetical protein JB92DRAFT_2931021 [Gautieria morchelliformis]|nr:hypothetical protein JB92DRAFT_2931021 [Gautieria morchelliformis]